MRVQLHQIRQVQGTIATVTFESPLGWGTAQWVGTQPEEGAARQVELAVPGVLTWGYEVAESRANEAIFEEDGRVCLVGSVRRWCAEDGVTALQIGDDLVLVEISNPPRRVPRRLIIRAPRIQLFDVLHWQN